MWTAALFIVVLLGLAFGSSVLYLAFCWFGTGNVLATIAIVVAVASAWRRLR